jgi:hypothetical protein
LRRYPGDGHGDDAEGATDENGFEEERHAGQKTMRERREPIAATPIDAMLSSIGRVQEGERRAVVIPET